MSFGRLGARALANSAEAHRLADEQLSLARASALPRALGIALRVCGLVEGGNPGLALLEESIKTLERSRSPLELARALSDYGATLRRASRRVQARTSTALEITRPEQLASALSNAGEERGDQPSARMTPIS